jgi:integrase
MAVDDGRLARSPCRRIALPRIEQSEKRFLAIDEVEHLAETISPRYRVFVLTGAYTGLRPGELAALRTDRLDLRRRQLRVEEPIKTPASRRTVSFSPFITEELTTHLDTYPGDKNLVFTAPEGGSLDLRVFRRRVWYPAVRDSVGEPMRPHDLRHTHVALLIAAGEDPYVISQRLGHASIRTTYDIYGHLFEGRDRQAADALEAARARLLADSAPIRRPLTRAVKRRNPPHTRGILVVELRGFEPLTPCMPCKCSAELSYSPRGTASIPQALSASAGSHSMTGASPHSLSSP